MRSVGEVLVQAIDSMPIRRLYKEKQILWNWPAIIGPDIAAQSEAVSVEFGVLCLAVRHSVWCHHLSMMKAELIGKVNAFVGEPLVKDVRFRTMASVRKKPLETEHESAEDALWRLARAIRLSEAEREEAQVLCSGVQDDKLRQKLLRVFEKHLKLRRARAKSGWSRCASCGAPCSQEQGHCDCCQREARQQKASEIRRMLGEVPWSTYAEINRYIPCTANEYVDAKLSLLRRVAEQLRPEGETDMQAKVLTMLFTGAKYDALSEALIRKTVEKFRRKTHVFAPR